MAGETIITVVGNLTADPELRYTQGGLAVANFTIASTPRTFDRQANDWKDGEALFLRASVWREFAENVAGTLTKGSRVVATGRLKQRSYETKEGEKRTSIELEIDEIGPSLRYATAQVTRAAGGGGGRGQVGGGGNQGASQGGFGGGNGGNQGGSGGNGGGNRGGGQAEEPWAPSAPAGGDVWSTPGSYNDETPF
ncbi:single-stranded DNA-binding protein [Rathayibacter festucae]|uniref:Single-stranded DNA-binding protein n=1 Tax=Rathayibacter festucae TaxID=110937 RepID=A0ABX6H4K1_9MICO|nr:single-stranded DNA-binding protein [Rathayibacter festucae]QHC64592.1 single-stranded DNA-binding protein [Rathayibacter festucae]